MNGLHDARVEAAAAAIHYLHCGCNRMMNHFVSMQDKYREQARAALAAADAVVTVPPLHPDECEPIAVNLVLRGVDLALDRLIRRDCFTERTLRVIDELREELALMRVGGQL